MSNKKKVKEILKAYKVCEKAFGMGGGIMEAGKDIALEDGVSGGHESSGE